MVRPSLLPKKAHNCDSITDSDFLEISARLDSNNGVKYFQIMHRYTMKHQ